MNHKGKGFSHEKGRSNKAEGRSAKFNLSPKSASNFEEL